MTSIDNSIMDWNDVIEDDEQEYVLLLKGIITSLLLILKEEAGSAKIPATNKATKSIQIFLKWVLPQ